MENRDSGIARAARSHRRGPRSMAPVRVRFSRSRFPIPDSRPFGFTLIELLVALAVFAAMAALAYGGLGAVARARSELAAQQESFQALARSMTTLERDLRQALARPVRGNFGEPLPAFAGLPDRVELTRAGFANPQAELRSNLERVAYALADGVLQRADYPVLDRAPSTAAQTTPLRDHVDAFRLRYLDAGNRWSETWPPPEPAGAAALPRAVEFRIETKDCGEIRRIVELVSPWPSQAVEAGLPPGAGGKP